MTDVARAGLDIRLAVDDPAVVAEVKESFERYEGALLANDLGALDELMWHDDRVVRIGVDDRQEGFGAISTFRRGQARQTPPRTLRETVVVTFGEDTAVVTTTFVPIDQGPVGRQQQTWVRLNGGWKIVAAHVSFPASGGGQPMDQQ
jgi:hypothetical protein